MRQILKIPLVKFVYNRYGYASASRSHVLEIRICDGHGRYKYISTRLRLFPKEWDDKNKRVINRVDAVELNKMLQKFYRDVMKILYEMIEEDNVDIFAVTARLEAMQKPKTVSFLEFCREQAEVHKHGLRQATKDTYDSFLRFLDGYESLHSFDDLTEKNIIALDKFLAKKGLKASSRTMAYHRFVKVFIRDAIRLGQMTHNPYDNVRLERPDFSESLSRRLSYEELEKIKSADLPKERDKKVRDLFLFQVFTCLSVADLCAFNEKLVQHRDRKEIYVARRKKSNVQFTVPLLAPALEILEKYKYSLPKFDKKYYQNLVKKVVANGILSRPEVSTHWARHTGATLLLNKGVPAEIVQKIMGHKKLSTTMTFYADLLTSTVVRQIEGIDEILTEK